jgi:D-galactosaminyltransferase
VAGLSRRENGCRAAEAGPPGGSWRKTGQDDLVGLLANRGPGAWIAAVLLWPVVAMVPGYLTVSALQPRRAALDRWAVAPLASVGVAFVAAIWIDWLRPGSGLGAAVAALLLTSAIALVAMRRRGQRVFAMPRRWTRSLAALVALMATSCVLGAAVVLRSAGGLATVVPNDDGNGHGSFVARILLTGSVDPVTVTTIDPSAAQASGAFYPLGLHVLAALVAALSAVPASLVVVGLLAGAVWAPLAVFCLARRFVDVTVAVVAAGVLALATPWFPYGQMAWGGWPLIVAVSLVPAALLVTLDLRAARELPVAVLALAGLFAVHITEFVVVGIVVGLVLMFDTTVRGTRVRGGGRMLLAALAALVLLAPFGRGIGRTQAVGLVDSTTLSAFDALREMVQRPYFGFQPPGAAFGLALTVWSLASIVLVVVGSRWLWHIVTVRGVVASTWLFLGLTYAAYVGRAGVLSSPWYGSGNRLLAQASALAVIPLSAALVGLVRGARRRCRGRVGTAALAIVGTFVCAMLVVRTVQTGDAAFARAMVTSDQIAAFRWLSTHSAPGDRVLNDPRAGSVWVYQATGGALVPVFGPKHNWSTDPAWAGREYLQAHVADAATDPRVRAEAATWHVRYVIVEPAVVSGGTPALDVAAILSSPGLREVFRSGAVRIYQLPG